MAYNANGLCRLIGTIDNSGPGSVWLYSSADSDVTVKAANYFSDALNKGMKVGDMVFVNVVGTGAYLHSVLTVAAAGATLTQTPATST